MVALCRQQKSDAYYFSVNAVVIPRAHQVHGDLFAQERSPAYFAWRCSPTYPARHRLGQRLPRRIKGQLAPTWMAFTRAPSRQHVTARLLLWRHARPRATLFLAASSSCGVENSPGIVTLPPIV